MIGVPVVEVRNVRRVYELTEEGRGLEPTLRALARWGMHRLPPPEDGTVSPAVAVLLPSVAVTVCAPATVAEHDANVHDPLGPIENTVAQVTSPTSLPDASTPRAV